ncbi:MAG TPA: hypothetical protein VGN14_06560 [Candidatus Elarobacter sp.]|jgi:hypothetical protein
MLLLAQTAQDPTAGYGAAMAAAVAAYGIFILVAIAFVVICNWIVAAKAGYNPALSLLMLIPGVSFIIYLIFVFAEWPVRAENKYLRAQLGLPPHGPVYPKQPGPTQYMPPPASGPITPV